MKAMDDIREIQNMRARKTKKFFLSSSFYLALIVVLIVVGAMKPGFLSVANMFTILNSNTMFFVAAAGMTMVILTGEMDLSIAAVAFMSACWFVFVQEVAHLPMIWAVVISLISGFAVGALNGWLVAYLKFNSMLTTLGLQIAYRGIALIISGGRGQISIRSDPTMAIGKINLPGGLSLMFVLALIVMVVLTILLKKTTFGSNSYAIGNNKKSAELVGLPVRKTILWAFIICGLCSALSGIFTMLKISGFTKNIATGLEFDCVAAVVIGGTSLFGGKGNVLPRTLFGVFLLCVIQNALTFLGASVYLYDLLRGAVILVAMYMDSFGSRKITALNE